MPGLEELPDDQFIEPFQRFDEQTVRPVFRVAFERPWMRGNAVRALAALAALPLLAAAIVVD